MPPKTAIDEKKIAQHIKARPWIMLPKLRSERAGDYQAVVGEIYAEIKPSGIIEDIYAGDIAWLVWEINRLRKCRALFINLSYRAALEDALIALASSRSDARLLSTSWFEYDRKDEVREILKKYDLDESVIEAEAVRRSCHDLESVDKLLTVLEARRDKALAGIADYRENFATQLRQTSDRLIEAQPTDVPRLAEASVKTSPE